MQQTMSLKKVRDILIDYILSTYTSQTFEYSICRLAERSEIKEKEEYNCLW